MRPATSPRAAPGSERLLYVDPSRERFAHATVGDLPNLLSPGDLLIVNDAATLPASLWTTGGDVEVRLVRRRETDADWTAVLFGAGDFHMPTELRTAPAVFAAGARLELMDGIGATVTAVDTDEPRLVDLRFEVAPEELFRALYRAARPIQYAYVPHALSLWDVQNRFASRPWALELPSAGHCLTFDVLSALRARDVGLAHLTHAAGISSTGSITLDRRLPLPERYEIGSKTIDAIRATRDRGGRVVAVGTTVVRALESHVATHARLVPGGGEARLVLGPGFRPKVVDGVLSGMHENGTSHFALLRAFASAALLEAALAEAERAEYLQHEFGDVTLVLPSAPRS